jgi:hypothetical protein
MSGPQKLVFSKYVVLWLQICVLAEECGMYAVRVCTVH